MAKRQDIDMDDNWFTGEDKTLEITILQDDHQTPQDITNWQMSWVLTNWRKEVKVSKNTVGGGIALSDPVNGVLNVQLAAGDTGGLIGSAARSYYHELKRTDSAEVLVFGNVYLYKSAVV